MPYKWLIIVMISCIWQVGLPFENPLRWGEQTTAHPLMIDIREYPGTVEAINAALNSKEIAEVKIEPKGIAVVVVRRTVKSIEQKK